MSYSKPKLFSQNVDFENDAVNVFPNPTATDLIVEFEKYSTIPRKVEIVDMLGRLQWQFETADHRNLLHLKNWTLELSSTILN